MKFVATVALLLFVAAAAHGEDTLLRLKRGLKIYDLVSGKNKNDEPVPSMVPKPQKPSSNFKGFNLEDALAPAGIKPTEQPNGGAPTPDFQAEIMQKLNVLFEIENLQMRMLQKMDRCK